MKQLCILRHAEAIPPDQADDDQGRALTVHGRRQCADRVKHVTLPFQRIIASPAVRTATTAELVFGRAATLETRLYNAPWHVLLQLIAVTPDSVESLAVVGHNPGISELAGYLAGEPQRLTTAGLLIFDVDGSWAGTGPATTVLVTARVD